MCLKKAPFNYKYLMIKKKENINCKNMYLINEEMCHKSNKLLYVNALKT
jgi:uncharacterized protein YfkK (UPF0435 family)